MWLHNKIRLLIMWIIFTSDINKIGGMPNDSKEKTDFGHELKLEHLEKPTPYDKVNNYDAQTFRRDSYYWPQENIISKIIFSQLLNSQQQNDNNDSYLYSQDNFAHQRTPHHFKRASPDYNLDSDYRDLYSNAMRMFQIGHFSRIMNRRRKQIRQQQMKEQAKARQSQSSAAPKSHNSTNVSHYSSQLEALALTDSGPKATSQLITTQPSSSKLSTGDSKVIYKNHKPDTTRMNNGGNYAFTSNHWGPLGKRGLRIPTIIHYL